jgi:23S rRNA pseudouridine2604 synthase
MEKIRLSKLMSEQGFCSRREADVYIERGWVLVDNVPVSELGTKVYPHQKITLNKSAQTQQETQVTVLMNKPIGYVSGQAEDGYQPAVVLFKTDTQWPGDTSGMRFYPAHLKGLAPAGRLDIDSQGLLVLTQDGRVAKQLIGENSEIEKEYLVRVTGKMVGNGLNMLNHGLSLDGQKLKPAKVSWLNEDQLRFILREGKKRQIRRMCELVGLKVTGLKRVRVGKIKLGELPVGQWRYLRADELF